MTDDAASEINRPASAGDSKGSGGLIAPDAEKCAEKQIALAKEASDSAAKQYDDYYRSFAGVDGKAQYTATISSFVLASFVALMNAKRFELLLSSHCVGNYLLVILPPVCALLSVILSLVATKVRDVAIPYGAADQIKDAENLADLQCDEFTAEHVLDYYRARLRHWKIALDDIAGAVERKSAWVLRSQILMVIALTLLLFIFVAITIKH
jgi:hypothetical protein